MCQIVDVKKDRQALNIYIINSNPVSLYVVCGGKAIKSETGLYLRIEKFSHLHSEAMNSSSKNKEKGDLVRVNVPAKLGTVRIILESRFKETHSMFLVNTYNYSNDTFNL